MKEYIVGLISDTHGLLRDDAINYLKGCDAIIHAGDICDDGIITQLAVIAPVYAIRGNMDIGTKYSATDLLTIGERTFYILHDLEKLDLDPQTAGVNVVVFGHSHRPESFQRGTVLYINPGSAGPKRMGLPISLARLHLKNDHLIPEFIELS